MGVILLFGGIMLHSDVIMDVKVEERTALATNSADDQIIEADGLWDDEILLDVHEVAG